MSESLPSGRDRLVFLKEKLVTWYRANARDLPWRRDPDPYRVWVSEIMLQQTRAETVIPYYNRFVSALPGVERLAAVDDEYLMKLWEGLGYYSRARNLRSAAGQVMERFGGCLPSSYEELLSLPGIGRYTAGAIASIAFGLPCPAVDGNVLRVLSRFIASKSDIRLERTKRGLEELIGEVIPADSPGDFNQALIEVGALLCLTGAPKCGDCPLKEGCACRAGRLWEEIPYKSPPRRRLIRERTIIVLECGERFAIRKRPPEGLLASLWELPGIDRALTAEELAGVLALTGKEILLIEALPFAKHIFSHIEWRMSGYRVVLASPPGRKDFVWASREEMKNTYALPSAFSTYTGIIFDDKGPG